MQIPAPNAFSSFSSFGFAETDETSCPQDKGPKEITFPSFFSLPSSEVISRQPFSSASCPVTGIVLLIGIPELPIVLSYGNPLAKGRNALAIARLPPKTLLSLEPSILSGCILSLLSSANLLSSCFSLDSEAKQKEAAQDNATISEIYSKEALIEILSSCGKIWENQRSLLFKQIPELHSGNLSEIRDYVQDATKILFPESDERKAKEPIPLKAETKIPVRTSSAVQPVVQFDIHVRLNIKKLSSELFQNETISQKAFSLLEKHCDTAEKITFGQKTSLISYLSSCGTEELVTLVKRMPISVSEEITDEISPSELAEKEGTAAKQEKKTARQMLAEWKAARAAKGK
jgi:hypothetical protein